MKALTIKDLAQNAELARGAMASVRGGHMSVPSYKVGDLNYAPSSDYSITATQNLFQMQDVVNATANQSAFVDDLHIHNNTDQFGQNNIVSAH